MNIYNPELSPRKLYTRWQLTSQPSPLEFTQPSSSTQPVGDDVGVAVGSKVNGTVGDGVGEDVGAEVGFGEEDGSKDMVGETVGDEVWVIGMKPPPPQ